MYSIHSSIMDTAASSRSASPNSVDLNKGSDMCFNIGSSMLKRSLSISQVLKDGELMG